MFLWTPSRLDVGHLAQFAVYLIPTRSMATLQALEALKHRDPSISVAVCCARRETSLRRLGTSVEASVHHLFHV